MWVFIDWFTPTVSMCWMENLNLRLSAGDGCRPPVAIAPKKVLPNFVANFQGVTTVAHAVGGKGKIIEVTVGYRRPSEKSATLERALP
jgi:hypothetical protein